MKTKTKVKAGAIDGYMWFWNEGSVRVQEYWTRQDGHHCWRGGWPWKL